MFNENKLWNEASQNEDEKMIRELAAFVEVGGFTAKQMRAAYERLCGIGDENEKDTAVEKIFLKMEEMTDKGLALNKLAEIIESRQDHEEAVPRYYQYIENLDIADKGKKLLHSIVARKRTGRIEFFVDGESIAEFTIKKTTASAEALAEELILVIGKIMEHVPKNKKCEFLFLPD